VLMTVSVDGDPLLDWGEAYAPAQTGQGHYSPHLTVGVAIFDDLKIIEAEGFEGAD
jgi:hypothetical protein